MAVLQTHRVGDSVLPVDYHMHTDFSDGDSSISAYVETAREMGLSEIAITDHCWRRSDWIPDYVETIRAIDEEYDDISILVGLEAKVIDRDGTIDVAPEDADQVDFVMGVVHRYQPEATEPYDDICNFDAEEAAELERDYTLELLSNPTVDVVGHPSRTYYKFFNDKTTPHYPESYYIDMIQAATEAGKPLEYNARLPHHPRTMLLELYVEHEHGFTIGSDSHHADRLSNLNREEVAAALGGDDRV
jgi:putative hydrolase